MRSFFKIFFACLLALVLFAGLMVYTGVWLVRSSVESDKPEVKPYTVLVLDLAKPIMDQRNAGGISLPQGVEASVLGLYDVVRSLHYAATDTAVKALYLLCGGNSMGYASSEEVAAAIQQFKASGKPVIAYSDYISERAYEVAYVASKIYCSPAGGIEWNGQGLEMIYFKKAFDRWGIQPEVFYAGEFKSATEPFRQTQMSPANRLQLQTFLNDHNQQFLNHISQTRSSDTALLMQGARQLQIRTARDAMAVKLVDGTAYDDQVKDTLANLLKTEVKKLHFLTLANYIKADYWRPTRKKDKIAVIYAEGELVDGPGEAGEIGGERFRNLMRKARLDDAVKAVVLRVNSPGGSVYASESIRREIELTKAAKPVVVSMGDYAASGGYYISCQADSIFANPSTLTGSIGVYVVLFDASKLLGNTLGITSDEVFTAPAANLGSPARPLSPAERQYLQQGVDTTYQQFKGWVALGRKLLMDSVELLARGRIWSGQRAIRLGLADKLGGLHDAITCAANMAKLKEYSLLEWPVPQTLLQQITGKKPAEEADAASTDNQQERQALTLKQPGSQWLKKIQTLVDINGKMQMRLPYFIP